MKRYLITATLAVLPALYATAAVAQEAVQQNYGAASIVQGKTHAQVRAEFLAARAGGDLPPIGEAGLPHETAAGTTSRADVIADTRAARARGELSPGESPGPLATLGRVSRVQ